MKNLYELKVVLVPFGYRCVMFPASSYFEISAILSAPNDSHFDEIETQSFIPTIVLIIMKCAIHQKKKKTGQSNRFLKWFNIDAFGKNPLL